MVKTVLCTLLTLAGLLTASLPAASQSREAFLELSADKAEVYVQEQLILSVQLYFSGALVQGDLSEPSHPDAIIERLGNQRESVQIRDGVRYQVIERRYAIFPQKPGTLTLPALRFEGHVRDASRRLRAVQDRQQLYDVPVKPIPASYPANAPWLPAQNLTLTSDGLPANETLEAGQNLTRQLTLQADGLPAEALPPFPSASSSAIRQYPEQPERHTQTTPEGLLGILQQSSALVPIEAGTASLPALTVPWWNTKTDQLEQASLPARQYQVTGARAAAQSPAPVEEEQTEIETVVADTGQKNNAGVSSWFWSTVLFAVLWLAFLGLWLRARGHHHKARKKPVEATHPTEKQAFERLARAVNQGSPQVMGLLVNWARHKYPEQKFVTTQDVVRQLGDKELKAALADFQASLFSVEGREHSVPQGQRKRLLKAIEKAGNTKSGAAPSNGLPPLYPPELSE